MAAKKQAGSAGVGLFPALPKLPEKPEEQGEDEEPHDQFCYAFNDALPSGSDDRRCRSCKKYLTTLCDQIEHFIDEEGDVDG
jgi:hypothetical protein